MSTKLKAIVVMTCLAATAHTAAIGQTRVDYSATEYLKNFALSVCLAEGFTADEVVKESRAAAGGYLELGRFPFEAHEEATALAKAYLAKEYRAKHGEKLTVMKCIDLFHSRELAQIAKKYEGKK